MINLISRKPLESRDIFEEIPVSSAYFMIPFLKKVSYLARSEKIEGYPIRIDLFKKMANSKAIYFQTNLHNHVE